MTSLLTASLEEIREAAARICRDYLTGQWKSIRADDIQVKRISGGLSNLLYHVSLPEDGSSSSFGRLALGDVENISGKRIAAAECGDNDRKRNRTNSGEIIVAASASSVAQTNHMEEPREVLLRIYGQTHGENALEAMITESVVFALLSERNFGPKLHGIFPGGRIEQYIPARSLTTTQLSDYKISMKIAEKMGEIHSLNIPMSKEPDWMWNCMERWLKSVNTILQESNTKNAEKVLQEINSIDFSKEIKWLKSVVQEGNYPVTFCHNDLQEGNILLRETETFPSSGLHMSVCSVESNSNDSVMEEANSNMSAASSFSGKQRQNASIDNGNAFSPTADIDNTRDSVLSNTSDDSDPDLIIIDFEYCAYNYRAFDLANHFLEWTFDYSNPVFPYYYHYKNQYPTQQQRYDFIVSYLKKLNETNEYYVTRKDEVHAVDKEVQIFSMFSHFFWTLWSVVNTTSNIEFGYWNYAYTRIQEYKQFKQMFLKNYT